MKNQKISSTENFKRNEPEVIPVLYNSNFSTSYNYSKHELQIASSLMTTPDDPNAFVGSELCPMTNILTPVFKIVYVFFISPYFIKFNCKVGQYTAEDASIPRKVITALLQFLNVLLFWGTMKSHQETTGQSNIGFSQELLYICFIALNLSFQILFWKDSQALKKLLIDIGNIAGSLEQSGECKLPSLAKVRVGTRVMAALYISFAVMYLVVVDLEISGVSSPLDLLDQIVWRAVKVTFGVMGYPLEFTQADIQDLSLSKKICIALPFLIVGLYSVMTWSMSFLTIFLWGLIFKELLKLFFQTMDLHCYVLRENKLLRNIRDFNRITMLIDDYNEIFGFNILSKVFCGILYISGNVWSIVNTGFGDEVIRSVAISACPVIFTVNLIACAEINKKASTIAFALKNRFQAEQCWRKYHAGVMEEVMHGISMIHYDLLSNSIGVKGHGFFTITYGFVGTVAGAIFSYAVFIRQLDPNLTKLI